MGRIGPWLAIAALLVSGCSPSSRQSSEPPLEPLVATPLAMCTTERDGVACGGEVCKPGPGGFLCPGDRTCSRLPDGLGGYTLMCQPTPVPLMAEQQQAQQRRGGGPERGPPEEEDNEELRTTIRPCEPSVIARVVLNGPGGSTEANNLARGFTEIVVPAEYHASAIFKPGPEGTRPYSGTLTGTWGIVGHPNPYTGTVTGDRDALRRGWDRPTHGMRSFDPGNNRPVIQQHQITATWDPDTGEPCTRTYSFTVTFPRPIGLPRTLDLDEFVTRARARGFPGTPGTPPTQTRIFHAQPPESRSRTLEDEKKFVLVPIGIYWVQPPDCCGIDNARRKVIQFARAAIHGPNGRLGKGWGLDIMSREIGDAPNHDPTFTGRPGTDDPQNVEAQGAGGARQEGSDVMQWDAPGMPKSLYDRLLATQDSSTYRQQFLSLLICRPPGPEGAGRHLARYYYDNARICQVSVTTVRWNFHAQRGLAPGRPYKKPDITITFKAKTVDPCITLKAFLEANGLGDRFLHPSGESRNLEIMDTATYDPHVASVESWEGNPFGGVRFP